MKPITTIIVLGVALLVGCGGLAKPYPDKTLHAIHVGDPTSGGTATPTTGPSKMVLRVDRVTIAEPFDATLFVYQLGDSVYKTDYYNGFVAPPGRLLTNEISGYISRAGLFATVLSGDTAADYQLSLEPHVTALYGDYREGQKPAAIVAVHFFVIDQSKGQFNVIFDKSYSQSTPIDGSGPEALVKAWEVGWTNVLAQLAGDLRASATVMNPP